MCAALLLLAAALLPFFAGCLSATPPAANNVPWTPPPRAQKPDEVWKTMREQKVDLSAPLTLAGLADIALRNNPATRKAWNDARAAAAQVDRARGALMPTISATARVSRQRTSAEPARFDQDYWKYGPALQLNYLIFNFGGGTGAAVAQAIETVYASDFAFNQSLQDVLLAVETAYYGLISAQAGVEAAEAGVKDAGKALEAAQARQASGVGTALEVLQAQAVHDQSLYRLAGARGALNNARGSLARAIGLPADRAVPVAAPAREVPEELAAPDVRRLIDEALKRRPDIASLRAALAAQKAAVKVANAYRWPSLYLTGSLARDYNDAVGDSASQTGTAVVVMLPDRDWAYSAGLNLQWTLFDGFQALSARRAAEAQAEAFQAQLEQAELAASADVWTSFHNYETALQKHTFSAAFLKSASASYELALDAYKAGLRSILDLLNAESQLAQARSQCVAARQEAFSALAGLAHAAGLLEKGGADQTTGLFTTPAGKDKQP